jgi:hypothetical protein
MARAYYHKRNLTQHIQSSHEGKKYECTFPDCGTKLSTQVSRTKVYLFLAVRMCFQCHL